MQFDWMVQCYAGDGVHRDTPMVESLERDDVLRGADTAVDVGLEGLWAPDHFMLGPHAEEYEVWTMLTTLAERTDDVDVGSLVNSVTYRNPALLAKMATTLDILSEGRLRLGLGAGWHDEGARRLRLRLPRRRDAHRLARRVRPDSQGDVHRGRADLPRRPLPDRERPQRAETRQRSPPAHRHRRRRLRMLRLIAAHADEWNVEISARARGKPIEFKVKKFDEYLEEAGRDPDDVERSWLAHILVCEDEDELAEYVDRIFPLPWGEESDMDDRSRTHTRPGEGEHAHRDAVAGSDPDRGDPVARIREDTADVPRLPGDPGMELFADEVMPAFV